MPVNWMNRNIFLNVHTTSPSIHSGNSLTILRKREEGSWSVRKRELIPKD